MLKSPVGTPAYEEEQVNITLEKQKDTMHYAASNCNTTAAYRIIQLCINTRPNYLLRTTPPDITQRAAASFDKAIDEAISIVTNSQHSTLPSQSTLTRHLQSSISGTSLPCMTLSRKPAFVASFIHSISNMPPAIWLPAYHQSTAVLDPYIPIIKELIPTFKEFSHDGASFDQRDISPDPPTGPLAYSPADDTSEPSASAPGPNRPPDHSQKALIRRLNTLIYNSIHAGLLEVSYHAASLFCSSASTRSTYWLSTTSPHDKSLNLTHEAFQDNLRLRMHLPPWNHLSDTEVVKCACRPHIGLSTAEQYTHFLTCPLNDYLQTQRHTAIKRILADALKRHPGVSHLTTESALPSNKPGQRSIVPDISLSIDSARYHLDVGIATPCAQIYLSKGSAHHRGIPSKVMAEQKISNWKTCRGNSEDFVPFVM